MVKTRFFRLIIKGTDLAKLENIRDWINTRLDNNDYPAQFSTNGASVIEENSAPGNYFLILDLYLKASVNVNKYKDIIVNQFTSLNKTGLSSAQIIQYDDCTHYSDEPGAPCNPTVRMEWNGD